MTGFQFKPGRSLALTAILILSSTCVAFAASSNPNVKGGSLSLTAPQIATDFPPITLNGAEQTLTASLSSWGVKDATGSAKGWHVTVQASELTESLPPGSTATALTLPSGSLTLTGTRTVTALPGSTPVDPTNGPLLENQTAAIDSGTAVTILDTNAGYGLGSYSVSEPAGGLVLTLAPATTRVDNMNYTNGSATPYSTTITYSIISGP